MSTASLKQDHELIKKIIKAMESTIQLFSDEKANPRIDFIARD